MRRVSHTTKATDLFGAGKHGFTDGEASSQTPGTRLTAVFTNDVQEELCRTIEDAGLTPDATYRLTAAIKQIIADAKPTNVISPAQITATQNNYTPTGWSTASEVRLDCDTTRLLNGFGPATVKLKLLTNINAANTLTFVHNDGGQTVGNKIIIGLGSNVNLSPGDARFIWHDDVTNCWRLVHPRHIYAQSVFASLIECLGLVKGTSFTQDPARSFTRYWPATEGHCLQDADFAPQAAPNRVDKLVAATNTWVLNLNGRLPEGAVISAVMVKWTRTTGDDPSFSLYSTDLFGDDIQTHETVAITATGTGQTTTLTASPTVTIDPATRLYHLLLGQGATASNLRLFSFGAVYTQGEINPP